MLACWRARICVLVGLSLAFLAARASLECAAAQTRAGNGAELVPQLGHPFDVDYLALVPGGHLVVSIGRERTLKLWDLETGLLVRSIEGGLGNVAALIVTPDGKQAITTNRNRLVKFWSLETGAPVRTLTAGEHAQTDSIALSPDGRTLFIGGATGLDGSELWDVESGRVLLRPTTAPRDARGYGNSVGFGTFTPDGKQLIAATFEGAIAVLDVPTGRVLRNLRGASAQSPKDRYFDAITLSPDGRLLLEGFHDDAAAELNIWDVANGKLVRTVRDEDGKGKYHQYLLLPGAKRALSISTIITAPVRLVDLETGKTVTTFEETTRAAVSSDGKRMVTAQSKPPGPTRGGLKLWDFERREVLLQFGSKGSIAGVAQPIDDRQIVLGGARSQVWDIKSARPIKTFEEGSPVALVADETKILMRRSIPNTARTEFVLRGLSGAESPSQIATTYTLQLIKSDGQRLAAMVSDGTMAFWDLASGQEVRRVQLQHRADSDASEPLLMADIAGDLKRAIGFERLKKGGSNLLKIWDTETGRELLSLVDPSAQADESSGGKFSLKAVKASFSKSLSRSTWFTPDLRRIISVGVDNDFQENDPFKERWRAKIWDASSGALLATSSEPVVQGFGKAFTSDSSKAYLGGLDGIIRVVDLRSANVVNRSAPQGGWVTSLALTPDGRRLIASVAGSHFRILDAATLQPLVTLISSEAGDWLAITPEGFFSGSEEGAKLLTVTRGFEVYPIDQVYQALYRPDLVQEKLAGDPKGLVREAAARLDLDKVMASGAAPEVRVLSPTPGGSVREDQVTAEAEITERGGGGGVGRVEWRVNGITLGLDARGLDRAGGSAGSGRLTVRQTLSLEPGENIIEVTAYNGKNLIASAPARIKVTSVGASNVPPRLFVLAVGVNDYYDSRLRLNFPVADAKALASGFQAAGKDIYESVNETTVLDEEVRRERLDAVFTDLAGKVRARDVFVFFIGGHGKTVDGRYYFLPQDFRYDGESSIVARGISQEQLQAWFAKIPARKSLLLFDTCESGSFTSEGVATRGLERVASLERLTRAMGRTVLSASTDDAPALEGYRGHGVFTYVVLDALGRADTDSNGFIEVTELASYVDAHVPEISLQAFNFRQVPQMKLVGSNFPLVRPVALLGADASAPAIPRKPTHVVITPADIFSAPNAAVSGRRLEPGTVVTLVRSDQGWALVAKDGKAIGYVAVSGLAPMQ